MRCRLSETTCRKPVLGGCLPVAAETVVAGRCSSSLPCYLRNCHRHSGWMAGTRWRRFAAVFVRTLRYRMRTDFDCCPTPVEILHSTEACTEASNAGCTRTDRKLWGQESAVPPSAERNRERALIYQSL